MDAPPTMKNINKDFFVWRMKVNKITENRENSEIVFEIAVGWFKLCVVSLSDALLAAIFNECGSSHRLRKEPMRH